MYFPPLINFRGNYSRAETIQGRKLLIFRRFLLRKLFKGGNYSRAETIRGNTVTGINKEGEKILEIKKQEDRFWRVGWKKIQKP